MIRLFAALALPFDIAEALAARQTGLMGARWRPREAFHITLRFFGEMPEDRAEDLDIELSRIRSPAPRLALEGLGAFGEGSDIRAVWAGVKPDAALESLARRCESAARRAGLKADTRAYRPHVTLAYLRRGDPAAVAAWIADNTPLVSADFGVDAFGLYSSAGGDSGARYQLERRYGFVGGAPQGW